MRNDSINDARQSLPALVLPAGYFDGPLFHAVPDSLWHEVKAAVRFVAAGARQSPPSRGVNAVGRRVGLPAGIVAVRFGTEVIVIHYPDDSEAREIVRLDCAEYQECAE